MPGGDKVGPGKAPWIMIGGSYPGALTAYAMVAKPDLFFAGYSSSGVVETIEDYWKYFEPLRNHMPRNCSADVQAVIAHIDEVFVGDNTTAIEEIKDMFGMSEVKHLNDVTGALRNNLWDWQALQVTSGPNAAFFRFCDALEVKDGVSAPESGWGLEHALSAWGAYWKNSYLRSMCGSQNAEISDCLTTYDPNSPWWTNTEIDYTWRSWWWIVCNEVGYFQNAPPVGRPAIVSRLVTVEDDYRQCHFMFPKHFPEPPEFIDVEKINTAYGGWDVKLDRIFFVNGERDPWLDATMSATGLEVESTELQPIALSEGFHCSDLSARSAINPSIAAVQKQALASMKTWLSTFVPDQSEDLLTAKIEVSIDNRVNPEHVVTNPPNAWLRDSAF
ncbi:hypothetical protein ONZ45_g12654 [Pleurotus djamor]|nr:hypothetical protein ONZ45_g12654 [Pleurotus djamor]